MASARAPEQRLERHDDCRAEDKRIHPDPPSAPERRRPLAYCGLREPIEGGGMRFPLFLSVKSGSTCANLSCHSLLDRKMPFGSCANDARRLVPTSAFSVCQQDPSLGNLGSLREQRVGFICRVVQHVHERHSIVRTWSLRYATPEEVDLEDAPQIVLAIGGERHLIRHNIHVIACREVGTQSGRAGTYVKKAAPWHPQLRHLHSVIVRLEDLQLLVDVVAKRLVPVAKLSPHHHTPVLSARSRSMPVLFIAAIAVPYSFAQAPNRSAPWTYAGSTGLVGRSSG
eukprot:5276019-Prymnesium_polylepis.1